MEDSGRQLNTNPETSNNKDDQAEKTLESLVYNFFQNVALITNLISESVHSFTEIKNKYAQERENEEMN